MVGGGDGTWLGTGVGICVGTGVGIWLGKRDGANAAIVNASE